MYHSFTHYLNGGIWTKLGTLGIPVPRRLTQNLRTVAKFTGCVNYSSAETLVSASSTLTNMAAVCAE